MGSAEVQGDLWGRAARDWTELQEPKHVPLFEAMLDAGKVGSGSRVCDVGCGGGGLGRLAAARGGAVSGIDAAGALIEVARDRVPDADYRIGDMESLPFPDQAFDAVLAANAVQYSADRVAALREFKRVCHPSGRVVAGLWGSPDRVEMRIFFGAVRDALPEPPPGKGPFELSEPGVLEELFEQAGLQVVAAGETECPFEYADFAAFWRAMVSSGPLQAALRSVDEQRLADAARSALHTCLRPDGSLRLENNFRYVVATP